MPLPFHRDNFSTAEPVKTVLREPDDGGEQTEYDVLDAIAEDFIRAVESKSVKLMKEVLGALLETAREQDVKQDSRMEEGEA